MEKEVLVYCIDCRSYRVWTEAMGCDGESCYAVRIPKYDHRHQWTEHGDPKELNKNNKCHLFRASRWFRFKKMILQVVG